MPSETGITPSGPDAEMTEPHSRLHVVAFGAERTAVIASVLRALPATTGLVFVAVCGEPEVELLRASSALPVDVISDGMVAVRDRVYVVPEGHDAIVRNGAFSFVEPLATIHAPIDRMFRALADACGSAATVVVLAGRGGDGTLGLKRVKEVGGLTICQLPTEADHAEMPLAAIASGMVDLVLPVAGIAERLPAIAVGPAEPPPALVDDTRAADVLIDALRDILSVVRVRTGHDFSQYKRATLYRRIARRMQVCHAETLDDYHRYLRRQPTEIASLLRDFLIGVTNFFRDGALFHTLAREVIPSLFAGRAATDQVRVWVAGCATGEEAYSLAMLLHEHAATLASPPRIQVFATDIDEDSLAIARLGLYSEAVSVDVSPERIERFFERENGALRVTKALRETVLFSPHNLLRDPPFSRLDLVTCRNLLIYFNRDAQDRALAMFHFGLRQDGVLMLGSSESADGATSHFVTVDANARIYRRRMLPSSFAIEGGYPIGRWSTTPRALPAHGGERAGATFGELHHRLVEQYAPPSLLVNNELDVVHLSERAGRFLEMSGGEPSRQLLRVVHPELRLELRSMIHLARQPGHGSVTRVVHFGEGSGARSVELKVSAVDLPELGPGALVVLFDELDPTAAPRPAPVTEAERRMEPVVRDLEDELHRTRDQLHATVEQYEASVEELRASNEELHAINGELRAASEELEASREELQSLNEALTLLNRELKAKVDEITRAHSDLHNLMTSTDIGVLFLDPRLNIKLFTPRALICST